MNSPHRGIPKAAASPELQGDDELVLTGSQARDLVQGELGGVRGRARQPLGTIRSAPGKRGERRLSPSVAWDAASCTGRWMREGPEKEVL